MSVCSSTSVNKCDYLLAIKKVVFKVFVELAYRNVNHNFDCASKPLDKLAVPYLASSIF